MSRKPTRKAINTLIRGTDHASLREVVHMCDGHTILDPQYLEPLLPIQVVQAMTETFKSDTRDPKKTIFTDKGIASSLDGVYGLHLLIRVCQALDLDSTSHSLGRGRMARELQHRILSRLDELDEG